MITRNMIIINAALIVIAALLLFHIFKNNNEMERLKTAKAKADAEMQGTDDASTSQNSHVAKDKSTLLTEANSPRQSTGKRPSPEEVSRILKRAKHDAAVVEAFEINTNQPAGFHKLELKNDSDCFAYWQIIEGQKELCKEKYEILNQILSLLNFSTTSDDDMQTLDNYVSLREKYSDILYDESASPDEITETYNCLVKLKSKAKEIISNAITYTYGERIQEYKKMKNNMDGLINVFNNTIGVKGFIINEKHYNIFIPEKED